MRLFSPFFWKRARRFIARFPRPSAGVAVLFICFIILAIANAGEVSNRKMKNLAVFPSQTMLTKEETWIRSQLNSFSADDKIKQLLIWGIKEAISSQSADLWKMRKPGGFLITGSHTKDQIASISASIAHLNLSVPAFIALDEEGGQVKRMTDDPNPGASSLQTSTDEEICSVWKKTNDLLRSSGVTMNFGVIGDIGWKKDVYMLPRTYSASPSGAAKFVALAIGCHDRVIPVVKHFPGHGRTVVDSHFGIPRITISEQEWLDSDALPFAIAIENDVPAIMIGHLLYDKIASDPASLSQVWQQKLRTMGFHGLTITDDLGMLTSSGYSLKEAAEKAFLAGNDMLLISSSRVEPESILDTLSRTASSSAEKPPSVDDRLGRILHEKYLLQMNLVP